jgi:hypothetical protein
LGGKGELPATKLFGPERLFIISLAGSAMLTAAVIILPIPRVWKWCFRSWLLIDVLGEEGFDMWLGLNQPLWLRAVLGTAVGAVIWVSLTAAFHSSTQTNRNTASPPAAGSRASHEPLAVSLEELADTVAKAPSVTVGAVGMNGGTGITGIANGPGVGVAGIASSSGTPVNEARATALRRAAQQVRVGAATKSQLRELILQNFVFFDPAVRAAMDRATASLDQSNLAN